MTRHAALLIASLCAAAPSSAQDLAPMCPAQRMPARYVDRPLTLTHDSLRIHTAAGYQHPGNRERSVDVLAAALELVWGITDDWELSMRSGAFSHFGSGLDWNRGVPLWSQAEEDPSLALAWRFYEGTSLQAAARLRLYTDGAELTALLQVSVFDRLRFVATAGFSEHWTTPSGHMRIELLATFAYQASDTFWLEVETGGVSEADPAISSGFPHVPYRVRTGATIMGGAAPISEIWLEIAWPYLIQYRTFREEEEPEYFQGNEIAVTLHGSFTLYR